MFVVVIFNRRYLLNEHVTLMNLSVIYMKYLNIKTTPSSMMMTSIEILQNVIHTSILRQVNFLSQHTSDVMVT